MDAKEIQAPFQLVGTRIIKFNMTNDFVTLNNSNSVKCNANYSIESFEEDDDKYVGIIRLYVKAVIKGEDKAKIKCDIIFEGCFISPIAIEKEKFLSMLGVNGCASLFSLSRAFICSATSLATSGGQMILPMINTFKLAKDGQIEKQAGSTH